MELHDDSLKMSTSILPLSIFFHVFSMVRLSIINLTFCGAIASLRAPWILLMKEDMAIVGALLELGLLLTWCPLDVNEVEVLL